MSDNTGIVIMNVSFLIFCGFMVYVWSRDRS